jgi:TorA maturation chaperone TorD
MNPPIDDVQPQADSEVFDKPLCISRQSLYRFAALTLSDPRRGTWEHLSHPANARLAQAASALLRGEPAAEAHSLGLGERPLADLDLAPVLEWLPKNAEALNAAYEQTFGLLVSSNCPPYETEYINSKFTFQRSQGLADIAGFYSAFGLEPSTFYPERHDHLALELEFMAFLLGLERAAAEGGDADRVERGAICREAQRKFLAEHLIWWVPTFARLLSKQDPGGFYDAVSRFLAALMTAERALAGIPVPRVQVTPSTVERPEECSGCLLNVESEL